MLASINNVPNTYSFPTTMHKPDQETIQANETLTIQVQSIIKMSVMQLKEIVVRRNIVNMPDYPSHYLSTLKNNNLSLALRAIIIGSLITERCETSQKLQVHAVRMSYDKDLAIFAGTGSGKTLHYSIALEATAKYLGFRFLTKVQDIDTLSERRHRPNRSLVEGGCFQSLHTMEKARVVPTSNCHF
ncbi:hypothetical protein Moror_15404 [Moniliophthora roreri MCA 2997]|uniref:DEAD/DEAH box helicase domain-containing protein n=1 Tax=Moniliophthora roreri (strain MCA 2997) TaxID=1381753 RepID=V2XR57_MONRO|nr:hypothetical protein Moror_15404 [Moniliophthora roreri MCA 2997]